MFQLDAELLKTLSGPAIGTLVVIFFMLGIIRPRSAVRELREDNQARLADKDTQIAEMRETLRISEESRAADRELSREILEVARTSEAAIRGLRDALEPGGKQ